MTDTIQFEVPEKPSFDAKRFRNTSYTSRDIACFMLKSLIFVTVATGVGRGKI